LDLIFCSSIPGLALCKNPRARALHGDSGSRGHEMNRPPKESRGLFFFFWFCAGGIILVPGFWRWSAFWRPANFFSGGRNRRRVSGSARAPATGVRVVVTQPFDPAPAASFCSPTDSRMIEKLFPLTAGRAPFSARARHGDIKSICFKNPPGVAEKGAPPPPWRTPRDLCVRMRPAQAHSHPANLQVDRPHVLFPEPGPGRGPRSWPRAGPLNPFLGYRALILFDKRPPVPAPSGVLRQVKMGPNE